MTLPIHTKRCRLSRLLVAAVAAVVIAGASAGLYFGSVRAAEKESTRNFAGRLPITELTEDQAILHALNRLGFGPRPGDVERVRQMGLENWIEQQLNPQRVDDSALDKRLDGYPTLQLSSAELIEKYPQPQQAAKQAGMTPEQISQMREQLQQRRQNRPGAPSATGQMTPNDQTGDAGNGQMTDMAAARPQNGAPLPQALLDMARPQQIVQELAAAKLTRAIYSERQLDEVMVDFWFNHFNVFAGKGADRWLLTSYERDTIRPHTLGKFGDLLLATAKSPAMQFYLDNWQSADPASFDRLQDELQQRRQRMARRYWMLGLEPPPQPDAQKRPKRGLNENYARELMELHTLGVQGGYTQKDVTEVARVFTGWTIRQPRRDPEFTFAARLHDSGAKIVLGKKFHGSGMREGEQLLEMLAHHPSTAHFISTKLAERFVSDNPPPALVDRMAAAFLKSDGDIRTVLRTMIYSPEFWSKEAYRAKIKTPFELVASTVRALGVDTDPGPARAQAPVPGSAQAPVLALVQWTARMGEPLYGCQPPNGYSSKADAWVNTGALLNRMNFALQVTSARPRVAQPALRELLGPAAGSDPDQVLAQFIAVFLGGEMSPESRATLEKEIVDGVKKDNTPPGGYQTAVQIAGLVLGSPEFQRR
jgi:uncharacterized protein (DUF1800 family)